MKKTIFIFLAFALYIFAGRAKTVFANCSFSSSISGGTISVIANSCTDTDTYNVKIIAQGEDDYSYETQKQPSIDGRGFLVDFTPEAGGAYKIEVYQGYMTLVYNATVTVEYQGPLSCGDLCYGREGDCPTGCPCTNDPYYTGVMYCRTVYSTPIPTSTLMPIVPPEQFGQDPDVFCEGDTGIETALGCIPFSVDGLVGFFLKNLMGLVGSVALIMIVYGSFLVMTSSGSPDKVAQGKEIITAAISGLLFAILSIFILRLIGVTWLEIPGFN